MQSRFFMERIGRDGRFAEFADDIHFSDIPNLAFWHDEIVSSKAVIIVKFRLVVLRCDDPIGRGGGGVGAGLFI